MSRPDDHEGILLIGHGTRDESGTKEFFRLASVLSNQVAPVPVEGCLLEFQHPTIPEAWQTLIDKGVTHIRVAPLLLFAAGHAKSDIPDALSACAAESGGVLFEQCGPLSRAPSIVDLAAQRIRVAADDRQVSGDESIGLVMVGRGSRDPCATTDMLLLGEVVAKRVGITRHAVGFYAMADPKLPGVLDEMATCDGIRTIIVQPHLLFQGRLYDAIRNQVAEAAARHPNVRFLVGGYLGPTGEVAEALARRLFSPAPIPQ